MKRVLLSVLIALSCVAAQAQITAFPYAEGFENNGTDLPEGWTQEQVSEAGESGTTQVWTVVPTNGGMFLDPASTHDGGYKIALGTDVMGGSVARLITPAFDLTGVADPQLKFWRTQKNFIGINALKVYYKTSAAGEWTLLESYEEEAADWTQATLNLPDPSADYYLAFEGYDLGGFGVQLDDIRIVAAPTGPVIGESEPSLNMGTVYNNLPTQEYTATYTVKNTGVKELVIASLGDATSPKLTVEGLPVAVNPGEQGQFAVKLSGTNEMEPGFFNGKLVLVSNAEDMGEFYVDVTATVSTVAISPYLYTDLGTDMTAAFPADWTTDNPFGFKRFMASMDGGIDNSPCMASSIGNDSWDLIQSGFVFMGETPVISFNYKLLQQPPMGFDFTEPVPAENFKYEISISKDNGTTWNVLTPVPAEHTATTGFAEVTADAGAYAGEICQVRFRFETVGTLNNARLWVDDFTIGTAPVNELGAVAVVGSVTPTALTANDYAVQVRNNGSASQEDYIVKLMQKGEDGDVEIGSQPGVLIRSGETHDFTFEWTPMFEGAAKLYGEVVMDDEYSLNNRTDIFPVTVQPGAYKTVTVGDGNNEGNYFLPYNTYYMQSLTQTLYFPHELKTNGGKISSLTYHATIVKGVVDLNDLPIQVWLGETDKDNLADSWVDPATLTCVFDGTIGFPVGEYDVTVNFDTPYEYKGGNLVVYSFRKKVADGAYGNMNNRFTSTNYPGSARSRANYLVDDVVFDPMQPDDIEIVMPMDFIPNTNFVFDFSGTGALTGKVDNGAEALGNVTVQVEGTDLYVLTDADGKYELPALVPGDYRMTVGKHGYFSQTFDVTVAADGVATLNATLEAIPTYTVSGKVTSTDHPDGVAGITLTLSGYHDYTATTDGNGIYAIEGVYENNTYTVQVRHSLYDDYDAALTVLSADASHNIELVEKAYPVFSAKAEKSENNVVVTWEVPVAGRDTTYQIDDNTPESGESVRPGNDVRMGNEFETTDEGVLKSVLILGLANPDAAGNDETLTVEVYDSNRQLIGTSDPFRLPEDAWVNVPLDNIRYSGTYYVMVRWQNLTGATNHMATDTNGAYAEEYLSWAYANGSWTEMYTAFRMHLVFMIRPNAVIPDESVTATPESYTVFRMLKGEEETRDNWTELTTTSELRYTDTAWSMLDEGSYRYAVTAIYAGDGNQSEPVFTKSVSTLESGVPAVDADMELNVYPNPVIGVLNIGTDAEITEIVVMDLAGKVVAVQTGNRRQIDLSLLPAGYYTVCVGTVEGMRSVKVVKQ